MPSLRLNDPFTWLYSCLLAMCSLSANAQDIHPSRFAPNEPGNQWQFKINEFEGAEAPGAYIDFEIELADTMISNLSYRILRAEAYDKELDNLFQRRCAFRQAEGVGQFVELDDDRKACHLAFPLVLPFNQAIIKEKDTLTISESTYVVDATATYVHTFQGSGGEHGIVVHRAASDVGVFYYKMEHYGRSLHPVTGDEIWEAVLVFARINGSVYGIKEVATLTGKNLPLKKARIPTLFPNPFNGAFNFEIEGFQEGRIRVEVYNMLGQRVMNRIMNYDGGLVRIELESAESGIYLLQVSDSYGRQLRKLASRIVQ